MNSMQTISHQDLTLRQQVAQRMICGYDGLNWHNGNNHYFNRLLSEGLGGVILFRENIQQVDKTTPGPFEMGEPTCEGLTPIEIAESNWLLQQHRPYSCPPLFISIDQEGGQVERFPWTIFPSGLSPRGVAQTESISFTKKHYERTRQALWQYGFNLNYFPTLDVNFNRNNPIIGVRAFGDDPISVWHCGKMVLDLYQHQPGVIPCIKHFPGHGHGQIDSHLTLPTLNFTEAELYPFRQAIDHQIPMVMINHGYYPELQGESGEGKIPASTSKQVIQTLLRETLQFNGLIVTDDMAMGAIQEIWHPVDAALKSLEAGVDILLYRDCGLTEWLVFEAIVDALETGKLSIEEHLQSICRILNSKKEHLKEVKYPSQNWFDENATPSKLTLNSIQESVTGLQYLQKKMTKKSLSAPQTILLVHPHRAEVRNYGYDIPLSQSLENCIQTHFENASIESLTYHLNASRLNASMESIKTKLFKIQKTPDWIIFVAFNSQRYPEQRGIWQDIQDFIQKNRSHTPYQTLVSAGMPEEADHFPGVDLMLPICTYRPQVLAGLPIFFKELLEK